jgi:hypothetical protein
MADTVNSSFGQVLVVFACFGEADGFYRISEHSSGKTVDFWKKNITSHRPKADETFSSPV